MSDGDSPRDARTEDDRPQPKNKNSRLLIPRILLWTTLAVLLVLAVLDYRAKSAANAFGEELRLILRDRIGTDTKDADLKIAEIPEPKRGTPVVVNRAPSAEEKQEARFSQQVRVYTWRGVFRDYSVRVYIGHSLGSSVFEAPNVVTNVEGPGEVAPRR